jgi:hypothetical protein
MLPMIICLTVVNSEPTKSTRLAARLAALPIMMYLQDQSNNKKVTKQIEAQVYRVV